MPALIQDGLQDGLQNQEWDEAALAAFEAQRPLLWHVAYRMLGVPADADDTVQECFVRLVGARPGLETDLRPWLVRVTTNLALDELRRRKTRGYTGPWLPGAIADDDPRIRALEATVEPDPRADTERRYSLIETISLGFLLAAEKLGPTQRAVLVLRDVFGFSTRETAAALDLGESNVKVTLHRAHALMRGWEEGPRRRLAVPPETVVAAMMRFFTCIAAGDVDAAEATLAADVVTLSDGGGEFFAAGKPVVGSAKVARFYANIARGANVEHMEVRRMNGVPTLVVRRRVDGPKDAPLSLTQVELDGDGRIVEIRALLATAKVAAVAPG